MGMMDIRAFVTASGCVVLTAACAWPAPELLIDGAIAVNTATVIEETWQGFQEFSKARGACFDPPRIEPGGTADNRGSYCPATGVIKVKVQLDDRGLGETLVHELAHLVEFSCDDHLAMRAPFTQAGPHPTSGWREGQQWAYIPSERFAEATVELFFGDRRIRAGVDLTSAELTVAAAWWAGEPVPTMDRSPTQRTPIALDYVFPVVGADSSAVSDGSGDAR
jgi:hypothetical protein